jgi:ATP-binding cassette subfamily B protein
VRSIGRILRIGRELWPYYLAVTAASVVVSATALLVPWVISAATDVVVGAASGGTDAAGATGALVGLAAALFGVSIAATLVSNLGGYLGDQMAVRLRAILSHRYFEHLLRLPQRYFDSELTGRVIGRLQRSITETSQFANSFANNFLSMLLTVAASLVIAATFSPWLALLLAVIYPIFTWLTMLTSRHWQALEAQKNTEYDLASGRFTEVISQIKVVKSYVQELRELRAFDANFDRAVGLTQRQSRWWHLMDIARRGILDLVFFAIYLIIFISTAQGAFSVGGMVMLIQLVALAKAPVMNMSYLVDTLQKAIAGSKDYLDALAEEPETLVLAGDDGGAARAGTADQPGQGGQRGHDGGGVPSGSGQGLGGEDGASGRGPVSATWTGPAVEFSHVCFSYDDETVVLDDVSFAIAAGERVAVVGESGGGKTTLTSLLLGLYRPGAGRVKLLGRDIADMPLPEVRGLIGVVFQDASLFSGTVRENIAYARADATDEQIADVARRSNAAAFIERFPNGYDSQIGERGLKLSGGQKQRIAIARAMLKDAPILVLDEATSSLDTRAERQVQEGLDELMRQRTTIVIAHRLSTISSVDRIITLRDGRVDEIGPPEELARSGGIYAELLALQASATKRDRKRLRAYDLVG